MNPTLNKIKIGVYLFLTSSIMVFGENGNLEFFQRFTTGKEPIKEAVVFRKLSTSTGKLINQEWLRFGLQGDSWYVEQLVPENATSTNLIHKPSSSICGRSYTDIWTVNERTLHMVDPDYREGSVPNNYGKPFRAMMNEFIALGIPSINTAAGTAWHGPDITWNGTSFSSLIVNTSSNSFVTNRITGHVITNNNGVVTSAALDEDKDSVIDYQYNSKESKAPTVIVCSSKNTNALVSVYEFVIITMGEEHFKDGLGYVPAIFVTNSPERNANIWTNRQSYTITTNGLRANNIPSPRNIGSSVFGCVAIITTIFLAVWLKRKKK